MSYRPSLTVESCNKNVLRAKYAVRGAVPQRAYELESKLRAGEKLPFSEVIYCNIGNPQQLNQHPITFFRQVMSLAMNPDLLENPKTVELFPQDAIERARDIVRRTPGGLGAYSHSMGLEFIREDVAAFLNDRDGHPADKNTIFLTNGASPGVQTILQCLIRDHNDGIMIPIPQYPLYSGTIDLLGGSILPYHLTEETGWQLEMTRLVEALADARSKGLTPRALCVINPGNPTGSCLSEESMLEVMRFCKREHIFLLADEVYQTNIYQLAKPFVSFRKVLLDNPELEGLELASFHSCSKGFLGECGIRGGYFQLENVDASIRAELYKLASLFLCPNLVGQVMVDLMVKPPRGTPSAEHYEQEKRAILDSLQRRARKLSQCLNRLQGVSCQVVEGAMYAFPKITIPQRACEEAKRRGQSPDLFYCMSMIDEAGICVVPGSGFGQVDGTFHYRTTILPPEDKFDIVMERMTAFHNSFLARYQ
ncbi:alanine transaminase [Paratrimastix pyriformis]|uniref:Alanine transaminase n=1 Tax=Paratrimastix pyriformis TaxID=342808 RepID=A0ABQ8UMD4_9EUKA|nr:alanine transaminase [Paratrimastix pyriformis]|eukprot:GAFH01001021.1.p2 GENE.GAFH01001021.1~~GAFH01001021.1.p2  ORF type:complete len:480 (-),score=207.70 GAFH01001021.1:249-1688(-)